MIRVLWRSWCVPFLTHTSRFRFSKHSNSEVTSLINVSGDHGYYPQKALDILQEGAIITLKVFSVVSHVIVIKVLKINLAVLYLIP
jgi:hypothetical protein